MLALWLSSCGESAVERGEVQGTSVQEVQTNGFHKGREKYTNIFQYGKKLPKGEMTAKNNIVNWKWHLLLLITGHPREPN